MFYDQFICSQIPFPSVSYCPELITRVGDFNYEIIVNELKNEKINILNLTENELKLMHAIGLVMNDDFLLNYLIDYNITIPTDDLMDYISQLNPHFRWRVEASFMKKYGINFAKIITPWGYCNTFNILDAKDLLHLNKYNLQHYLSKIFNLRSLCCSTSEDFHYERSILFHQYFIQKENAFKTVESNESYPWSARNSQSGFIIAVKNLHPVQLRRLKLTTLFLHPKNVYDGIHFIFHNTDELITKLPSNQQNFFGQIEGSVLYWIKPQVTQIDVSIKAISFEE